MEFKPIMMALVVTLWATGARSGEFSMEFDWSGLELCTSGQPNIVDNPKFTLSNVPKGTAFVRFWLKDRNVPDYTHGGGVVAYHGSNTIAPGAFRYKSPCPPNGRHYYEWTATAQRKKSGGRIEIAKSAQMYP